MTTPIIEAQGLTKRFGEVEALADSAAALHTG
jgi:ABC-type sugar transport system ATPase subunit